MLATSRGPLAPVWRLLHMLVLRAVAAWLHGAAPGSSAFVSGSFGEGRPLYGVSGAPKLTDGTAPASDTSTT
jgi:hypothetical protein